jgi:Flp pilus assembly protein protease CpaA
MWIWGNRSTLRYRKVIREVAPTYPIPVAVVLAALLGAAITDVRDFRVPNWLTGPLFLSGVLYHTFLGGWPGLGGSLLGVLVGLGLTLPLHLAGGMGAGDVKLLAAIGAWLGALLTVALMLGTALVGGAYALGVLLFFQNGRETGARLVALLSRLVGRRVEGASDRVEAEVRRADRRARAIPYAAVMAVSYVILLLWALGQKGP